MKKELGDFAYSRVHNEDSNNGDTSRSKISNQSLLVLEDFKKKQYWKDKEFS